MVSSLQRVTLSHLLNGKAGVSANMALATADIGWGPPITICWSGFEVS